MQLGPLNPDAMVHEAMAARIAREQERRRLRGGSYCNDPHFNKPNVTCRREQWHTGVHESAGGVRWWGNLPFPELDRKTELPDRPQLAWKGGIPASQWPDSPDVTPPAAAQNLSDLLADAATAGGDDETNHAALIPIFMTMTSRQVKEAMDAGLLEEAEDDPLS